MKQITKSYLLLVDLCSAGDYYALRYVQCHYKYTKNCA